MATISVDNWILFVSFLLIYLVFLCYDMFKRGENYGNMAYLMAILPANYLWYIMTKTETYGFGAMGAMMVLALMWALNVIRDIFLKDAKKGYKDADDVGLFLCVGILIQFILSAVIPDIPGNEHMQNGCKLVWKYFYLPAFDPNYENAASADIILGYKILATIITVLVMVPVVMELKNEPVNIIALIIITVIFLAPFAFLAYLWMPQALGVMLVLISILFFIMLLMLTRGTTQKKR